MARSVLVHPAVCCLLLAHFVQQPAANTTAPPELVQLQVRLHVRQGLLLACALPAHCHGLHTVMRPSSLLRTPVMRSLSSSWRCFSALMLPTNIAMAELLPCPAGVVFAYSIATIHLNAARVPDMWLLYTSTRGVVVQQAAKSTGNDCR